MHVIALAMIAGLFVNDNAEFFSKANEQIEQGMEWTYVGPQTADPDVPSLPLVNEETGEKTILFELRHAFNK